MYGKSRKRASCAFMWILQHNQSRHHCLHTLSYKILPYSSKLNDQHLKNTKGSFQIMLIKPTSLLIILF